MPCLAPAALGLVELCKNWSKWRNSRDFVVFLFLDTFEYDKMSRNRWNDKIPWESHLFKGLCSFSCFLTFFVIKSVEKQEKRQNILSKPFFSRDIVVSHVFDIFFVIKSVQKQENPLKIMIFCCFPVSCHFWIQKVSIRGFKKKQL